MADRKSLIELVKSHFAFLVEEFDFQLRKELESSDSLDVQFCSNIVFVRILAKWPTFEPQMTFGRIGIDDRSSSDSFDWVDLAGLEQCEQWKWQRRPNQPYNGRISELARMLRECGEVCLRGDDQVFEAMINHRESLHKKHLDEEHQIQMRKEAERAWQIKDFNSVVKFYDEIRDELTHIEQVRRDYAIKKMLNHE